MKPQATKLILLLSFLFATGLEAQTPVIDVSFPDGTGTNPGFSEIDNGLGGGTSTWTQATGVLFSNTTNNSAVGAASDTTIDFTTLGNDSLVLTVDVSSRTGTQAANGMFIGFQQRNNGGTGADLWNNNPPSFGLLLPGAVAGFVQNGVSVGGSDPSAPGRYQASPTYGVATGASISDGFSMTLTVDSTGWDLAVTGLETAGAVPITGGSGTWGVGGINDWAEFNNEMRVGASYQTTATGGNLTFSRITLVRNTTLDSDMDGMPDEYEDATPGLDKEFPGDASQGANDGLFDNDGLTNLEEYNFGTDPNVADVDGDDLNDGGEFAAGTDPFDDDSDDDGLNDGAEVNGTLNPYQVGYLPGDLPAGPPGEATDPLQPDSDFDGLGDFVEIDNGNGSVTDPNYYDTDGDGLEDAFEIATGLDPTDPTGDNGELGDPDLDDLTNSDEQFYGTNPLDDDSDDDSLKDGEEVNGTLNPYQLGHIPGDPPGTAPGASTDPLDADSDDDGLADFAEIDAGNGSVSDPNDPDTDLDTLLDGFEVAGGLDPTEDGTDGETADGLKDGPNGAAGDPDGDTVLNDDEQFYGSNPNDPDSDDDTLDDGEEIFTHLTNPARADTDGDLIRDDEELVAGADGFVTNPLEGDTDSDTYKDHIEVEAGSNPELDSSIPSFPAISWAVEAFDQETDLSTEGTLLFADNLHGEDVTVNGIPFIGYVIDGTDRSTPHLQTLLDSSSPPINTTGLYDNEVPALFPLLSVFWFQGNPFAVNFGITGLTPGKTYLVQVGRADDRSGDIINRFMLMDGYGGNNALDPIGPTNSTYGGPLNPAILFTGTFTAQFTVQAFKWEQYLAGATPGVTPPLGSHIPFIQVREIEAPTSITVTGLRRIGATFEADFAGLNPAMSYQLVRSAKLDDGFPTVVDGPRLPAGATDTFTDPAALSTEGFYRLEEMP